MAVSVKKKIWFGTLFLFLLLLVTGGVGIYYMAKLKREGQNVLEANYESLSYCHLMQQQLNEVNISHPQAIRNFENALQQQENNLTEPGEEIATAEVQKGI